MCALSACPGGDKIENKKECLGVGPTKFWKTISHLKKNSYNDYFCASSGCLAIVSKDIDFDKFYNIVKDYDLKIMKNVFIDEAVKHLDILPNITIVTGTKYGSCIATKITSKQQLKNYLITTTNDPFINREFDGTMCYNYLNRCRYKI
jgi:hypothetical protein